MQIKNRVMWGVLPESHSDFNDGECKSLTRSWNEPFGLCPIFQDTWVKRCSPSCWTASLRRCLGLCHRSMYLKISALASTLVQYCRWITHSRLSLPPNDAALLVALQFVEW